MTSCESAWRDCMRGLKPCRGKARLLGNRLALLAVETYGRAAKIKDSARLHWARA
jgi:hypothetical protein